MISETRLKTMAEDTVARAKKHGYAPGTGKFRSYLNGEWQVIASKYEVTEADRLTFVRFALHESGVIA